MIQLTRFAGVGFVGECLSSRYRELIGGSCRFGGRLNSRAGRFQKVDKPAFRLIAHLCKHTVNVDPMSDLVSLNRRPAPFEAAS
jgi:hypothetical protein